MSAVTAGSPHNSIARGRSSICHDRAARRPVLNFSISALTAAEDRQKSRYHRSCTIQTSMRATEASVALQAGTVSLAVSKLYTRAVLPPAILACSSSGQNLRQDLARLGKRRLAVRVV